jgi:peptidoglycan/xylan/chitin deacetylase (PgdA/CDA1 family)
MFGKVLDLIVAHFEVVPLSEAMARLRNGRPSDGTACITFDDGYVDWPDTVCPILQARKLPATFFVTTSQLDGAPLWSERISYALQHCPGNELQIPHPAIGRLDLSTPARRLAAAEQLTAFLKYLRVPFRDDLIARIEEMAQVSLEQVPRFTEGHLRSVHGMGFDIGSHTVAHPILTYCDEAESLAEIQGCRERLQSLLDADVPHFAYPNGKPMADFSDRDIRLVKRAGYTGAVTTALGTAPQGISPFQVPRFTPWARTDFQMSRQLIGNLIKRGEQLQER